MKILVFGASGMIGNAFVRVLSEKANWQVFGTLRSADAKRFFAPIIASNLITGVEADNFDALVRVFARIRPDVVVNCIGLTKHHKEADDSLLAIPVNALLPHRLANLCAVGGARLVQVSTDCVFSGAKGDYAEGDVSDAKDTYGKAKYLGEVDYPHAITLRTSTIGHELQSKYGLLDWFLSQETRCKGYTRAVFSGLPTVVFAQIVRDVVIPNTGLAGLYHVAAKPIAKFDLLKLIARQYGKTIDIVPDESLSIDRSLNAARFRMATGYVAPEWPELIGIMHAVR
jgi:dTDP-4-dehydrorhamnose reductase